MRGTSAIREASTSSAITEPFASTKTSSIARVGTSAMRIRRKALATEASIPMREKEASMGVFLWNWILKFFEGRDGGQFVSGGGWV